MKYSKETKTYIKSIRKYLEDTYGSVKSEWEVMLMLLGDNLEMYKKVSDTLETSGIYSTSTGLKNPLLSTQKDIAASIYKIVQHFGISPYAASKIKAIEEDSTDDFIDGLVN